jgi:hypothetical protein
MSKRYEDELWRIEHADNATITFTIALHGPHAWDMRMEDSSRYHSISHGWAAEKPQAWEHTIAPLLRQFFDKTPDLPIQTISNVLGREIEAMNDEWCKNGEWRNCPRA